MKHTKKKGFTLLELVIVVSVIAILAAVLIPTFVGIINNARLSVDVQTCKSINNAYLVDYETKYQKPENASEVIKYIFDQGFALQNVGKSYDTYVVYDFDNNRLALVNKNGEVVYKEKNLSDNLYAVIGSQSQADAVSANMECNYIITTDNKITIVRTEQTNVVVDTTLVENANVAVVCDYVDAYMNGGNITATVADESLHIHGKVNILTLKQGHVEIEKNSQIDTFVADVNDTTKVSNLKITNMGTIDTYALQTGVTIQYASDNTKMVTERDFAQIAIENGEITINDTKNVISEENKTSITDAMVHTTEISESGDEVLTSTYGTKNNPYILTEKNIQDVVNDVSYAKLYTILSKDIELTDELLINKDRNIILDLNGHTLSRTGTATRHYTINNLGTLTICDNSVTQTGKIVALATSKNYNYTINNAGNLIINGGTIAGASNVNSQAVQSTEGYIEINRGKIVSTNNKSYGFRISNTVVEINDGYISGKYSVYMYSGSLNINGGTFEGVSYAIYQSTGATSVINDGMFKAETAIYCLGEMAINDATTVASKYGVYSTSTSKLTSVYGLKETIKGDVADLYGYGVALYSNEIEASCIGIGYVTENANLINKAEASVLRGNTVVYYAKLADCGSASSTQTINLLKDIEIIEKKGTDTDGFSYGISTLNAVLEGNNHTITMGKDLYLFRTMYGTLKNVNVVLNNASITVYGRNGAYFYNVNALGQMEVSNNTGAYCIYAGYGSATTIKFEDCISNVYMIGGGASTNYNAVFVGYNLVQSTKKALNLVFTNCVNEGTLICGKASMFLGNNPSNYLVNITATNCINNGLIQATYTGSEYIYNCAISSNGHLANNTVTIDDFTCTGSNIADLTMEGNFIHGPQDTTLAITKNADDTFTITPSNNSEVSYYKVTSTIYTKSTIDGTLVFTYTEKIIAGENMVTTLKDYAFVDYKYLENNEGNITKSEINGIYSSSSSDLDDNNKGKAYIVRKYDENGEVEGTYYLVNNDSSTLDGKVRGDAIITVSAYDDTGKLISSSSYTR